MPESTVLLRLVGAGRADRVRAWVEALGRVPGRRVLELRNADGAPDLGDWCRSAGVERAASVRAPGPDGVLVIAAADDLPTSRMLARLVTETTGSSAALETRVLPCAGVVDLADNEAERIAPVCLAVPGLVASHVPDDAGPAEAVVALRAADVEVRRAVGAAVFTDSRPDDLPATHDRTGGRAPASGHPATLESTSLHRLLVDVGLTPPDPVADLEERPLLSVLTRTQGTRLLCLEEVLTCLAAQTCDDFEVLLACHRAEPPALAAVRALVDELGATMRERVRVLTVDRAGRSAPLNDALEVARGRYAVMLDDDDAVTAGWVAAFAQLEADHPGTVLRSAALAEHVHPVPVDDVGPAPVATGPVHPVWPDAFSLVEHLWDNASPPMTFAVPRGVFADLGHRFDESLDTTEDWDFLVRAAALTGVASTPARTGIYRVWTSGEGSRHLHDQDHWAVGRDAVLAGIDRRVILLAPGDALAVRELRAELEEQRAEKFRFAALNEQAAADLSTVNEAVVALRARVAELEERVSRLRRRLRQGSSGEDAAPS